MFVKLHKVIHYIVHLLEILFGNNSFGLYHDYNFWLHINALPSFCAWSQHVGFRSNTIPDSFCPHWFGIYKSYIQTKHSQYCIKHYGGMYITAGNNLVIWVIDETSVNKAIDSYMGDTVDIEYRPADYSIYQLEEIEKDIKTTEISPCIVNTLISPRANRIYLTIGLKKDIETVKKFINTYKHKAALLIDEGANPST